MTLMVGNASIRVTCFLVLGACGAMCQERGGEVAFSSLPDAPSVQAAARMEGMRGDETGPSSLTVSADTGVRSAAELASGARAPQPGVLVFSKAEPAQKESGDFFEKYLYPTLQKRHLSYHPSTGSGLMGRATYATSRVFVTRDASGKGRVNTSYFVGVLTSALLHTAYRPYWNRSVSAPFSSFGSTIGNDAGMNVLHEFGPGLEQMMRSHTPKFVSKIQQRIGH